MHTLAGDLVTDEVLTAAFGIPYPDTGASFMNGHATGQLVRRTRLTTRWREHTLVLIDDSGTPLARGTMIPYCAGQEDRGRLPSGGWDEVAIWAAEDAMDGSAPDSLCALEIVVTPERMGEGLSAVVLAAMKQHAQARALSLVAPVRPPDKASKPWQTMQSYVEERRSDGLPADRWLRVHLRAGGRVESIASHSMTISAPLASWRAWTGLDLSTSGQHRIPGGLVPLIVDTDLVLGVYVEPNVWVRHL